VTTPDQSVPSDPPLPANIPASPQPPVPLPDLTPDVQPPPPVIPPTIIISEDAPNGASVTDLIRYAIADRERTDNLERLIWTGAILVAVVVGTVSGIVFIVWPHLIAGEAGLAAAAVALVGWIRRWVKRRLRNKAG
jgi:hypothetical protein